MKLDNGSRFDRFCLSDLTAALACLHMPSFNTTQCSKQAPRVSLLWQFLSQDGADFLFGAEPQIAEMDLYVGHICNVHFEYNFKHMVCPLGIVVHPSHRTTVHSTLVLCAFNGCCFKGMAWMCPQKISREKDHIEPYCPSWV